MTRRLRLSREQAGSRGGAATYRTHGSAHYRRIGRIGGRKSTRRIPTYDELMGTARGRRLARRIAASLSDGKGVGIS